MEERSLTWQMHLLALIRESGPDKWIVLGDLYACIADEIPLHTAGRLWRNTHPDMGLPDEMRWRSFRVWLNHFEFTYDPPNVRGTRVLRSARIRPVYRTCVHCGTLFFNDRTTIGCTASCGVKHGKQRRSHEVYRKVEDQTMPRLPEAIAIETIIEALVRLSDPAARRRVMQFVNAYPWDDAGPVVVLPSAPPALNGESHAE
jgi:hypothetical protein